MRLAFFILAAVLLFSQASASAPEFDLPPQHPIANFTMNFLKGLGLGKVSFDYIPCIRTINSTLLTGLDIPLVYHTFGIDGLLDSITYIISNLFDLNTTCQVTSRELAYALSRYLIEFKDDNYFLAVLREFPHKIERWIEQTVRFKSCFYYGWWGCAGRAAGRFCNIVFNATPRHKPKNSEGIIRFDQEYEVPSPEIKIKGKSIRLALNSTFNALESSGLLSARNASAKCRDYNDELYRNILIVIDMFIDSKDWKDGMYQLLYGLKNLNGIYRNCKNVLKEFVEVGKIYLSTLGNWKSLLNHVIFRSKPLMSRGMVTAEALKGNLYEDFGTHLGYLINIILWE